MQHANTEAHPETNATLYCVLKMAHGSKQHTVSTTFRLHCIVISL